MKGRKKQILFAPFAPFAPFALFAPLREMFLL
jgi:hypothetical protein